MFLSELYKALRKKEILILLVLGIAFDVFMSSKNSVILPQGVNRNVFREYIAKVAGEYTDEKKDFIISERDKYQSYTEQWGEYEEKYRSGEIEPEEYSDFMHNFKEAERKLDTLEYLVSKSLYYEELSKISAFTYCYYCQPVRGGFRLRNTLHGHHIRERKGKVVQGEAEMPDDNFHPVRSVISGSGVGNEGASL